MRVITKLIHLKIIVGIIFGNVKIENRFRIYFNPKKESRLIMVML